MNSEAHTHELKFRPYRHGGSDYPTPDCNGRKARGITYGDQEIPWPITIPFFLEKRRERTIRRIIEKHDKASIIAGIKKTTGIKQSANYSILVKEYSEKEWSK